MSAKLPRKTEVRIRQFYSGVWPAVPDVTLYEKWKADAGFRNMSEIPVNLHLLRGEEWPPKDENYTRISLTKTADPTYALNLIRIWSSELMRLELDYSYLSILSCEMPNELKGSYFVVVSRLAELSYLSVEETRTGIRLAPDYARMKEARDSNRFCSGG